MEIELIRKGDEVFYQGMKLHINPQRTHNYPIVEIEKLGFTGYQKSIGLSTLKEGTNIVTLKPQKIVESKKLMLTLEEQQEIAELEAKIAEIKENARKRAPIKKTISIADIKKLSPDEIQAQIAELEAYLATRKGE